MRLDKKLAYSNEKAKTTLGFSPRPLPESVADSGRRMVELGVV